MGKVSRKKRAFQTAPATPPPTKPLEIPGNLPFDRIDRLWLAGISLLTLAVYIRTLCPTIYTSGAGENVTAVATLGVPHPPGFPLFCILGKLFTVLVPAGSVAFRINL